MKIPANKTEAEVLQAIERVVNMLAPSFKFGYFDVDDIKQEGRKFALQALSKYDCNRPLENFLYRHVRNRLINFKRDNYRRNDPPCKICHNIPNGETAHPDGQHCSKYISWAKRNTTKQNIMYPLDISNISDERETTTKIESSVLEDISRAELLNLIDAKLPVELRSVYLQMQQGISVPKSKKMEVEKIILDIVKGSIEWEPKEDQ